MRAIVLDTETTGLNPKDGHRIIAVACAEIRNRMPTGRTWHWHFNPRRSIDQGAFDVHGISEEFLKDCPQFFEAAEDILDVIGGDTLVIHNAAFDVGFLNAEFRRLPHYPLIGMDRVICTLEMARKKFPGKKNNLDALCDRFKINRLHRIKHDALLDVELLTRVYLKLDAPKQECLDLTMASQQSILVPLKRPKPLKPLITPEELQAHSAIVAGLGSEAIWNRYA